MIEEWKEVDGFRGYFVSNLGRIKSHRQCKDGLILKQRLDRKGYCAVMMSDDSCKKHNMKVHRIVLKTFNPVDNMDSLEVNHKDEDKTNNRLENLEWVTHLENVRHGTGHQRATEPQKMKIKCIENGIVYNSMKEVSDDLNISYGDVSRCCSGKLKSTHGFSFEVIDYGCRPHPQRYIN